MNARIADVIIHTRQTLDDRQFAELARRVYESDGVVSLGRNRRTPRFLMLVYNAARIQASQILEQVRHQGHDATLVGI